MTKLTPRCLTKQQAADYCGLSLAGFGEWVRTGIIPQSIPTTHRWDKKAIDVALDRQSGIAVQSNVSALDEWRAKRDARRA